MSKKKSTIFTLLSTIVCSAIVSIFGFVYNQKIMELYGSETNGLVSTLSQFVSLFTLLEGGFTTASLNAIYGPISRQDENTVFDIIHTTRIRFRKIGLAILALSLLTGSFYLLQIDSALPFSKKFALLVVTATSVATSIAFQSEYSVIYNGYNKQYVQTLINLISKTITWVISIVLIFNLSNIVVVYAVNMSTVILNVLICRVDSKWRFHIRRKHVHYRLDLISGTKDVLVQKLASTVFTSTDLVLISAGTGLAQASVYNVYHQIIAIVDGLLTSVILAPTNSFGLLYNEKDSHSFQQIFCTYQKLVLLLSTVFLSVTSMTIVNFVRIYTAKVSDVNYVVPGVALLFFAQFYITIQNKPLGMILNISKNFKQQNLQCILSAVVNIVCSVVLMTFFGIQGIILGSVFGVSIIYFMNLYRCVKLNLICDGRHLLGTVSNFVLGILGICVCLFMIEVYPQNYIEWFALSLIEFVIWALIVFIFNIILSFKETIEATKFIIKIAVRKNK